MATLVVVDIGNSRLKWGRCEADRIVATVSLPYDPAAWAQQLADWKLSDEVWWIAGVVPAAREQFANYLRDRGRPVRPIDSFRDLPIVVDVDRPERVGIDRLLNAVALDPGPALIVDAGSAVTVDCVDANGVFRGGAIFPGLRLMAKSLNDYTAQLPQVSVTARVLPPGRDTTAAIQTGVFHAVVGGIDRLLRELDPNSPVWCTGGDASLLTPHLLRSATVWPEMTLEGLRRCAKRSLANSASS